VIDNCLKDRYNEALQLLQQIKDLILFENDEVDTEIFDLDKALRWQQKRLKKNEDHS